MIYSDISAIVWCFPAKEGTGTRMHASVMSVPWHTRVRRVFASRIAPLPWQRCPSEFNKGTLRPAKVQAAGATCMENSEESKTEVHPPCTARAVGAPRWVRDHIQL